MKYYFRAYRRQKTIERGGRPRRPVARNEAERRLFRKLYPKGKNVRRTLTDKPIPTQRQLASQQHFVTRRQPQFADDDYPPDQVQARLRELKKKGIQFRDDEED